MFLNCSVKLCSLQSDVSSTGFLSFSFCLLCTFHFCVYIIKLRHTNIYERSVGWGPKGLNPKHNRSHQFYTERISSHFQRTVINSLNKYKMDAFNKLVNICVVRVNYSYFMYFYDSRVMKVAKTRGPFDTVRREAVSVQIQEEIQLHVNYGLHL